MANFAAFGSGQTSDNTLLSMAVACGATLRRGKVFDIVIGSAAAAADGTFNINILRVASSAGTSTAVTPSALDAGDATAATATVGKTFTVNPTGITPVVLNLGFNQRSTMRWFAAPGEELVYAATQFAGFGIQPAAPSPTASNIAHTIVFTEV